MRVLEVVKNKNRILHYLVVNSKGQQAKITKDALVKEIEAGNVENAKIQHYNGSTIVRIDKTCNKKENNYTELCGEQVIKTLKILEKGTPLRIKSSPNFDFEQVIYTGIKEVQGQTVFTFFNNEGLSGCFGLSERFIINYKIEMQLNNNEPEKVAYLLSEVKKFSYV